MIRCAVLLVLAAIAASPQEKPAEGPGAAAKPMGLSAAAEDISGTYTFLHSGDTLEIIIDADSVSGYVVRRGDRGNDKGMMLTHFFQSASVEGHDVSFTTKSIHGVWFEFAGRFERGKAKTRAGDGYYVLKGELKEFSSEDSGGNKVRSRRAEFKWIGRPE